MVSLLTFLFSDVLMNLVIVMCRNLSGHGKVENWHKDGTCWQRLAAMRQKLISRATMRVLYTSVPANPRPRRLRRAVTNCLNEPRCEQKVTVRRERKGCGTLYLGGPQTPNEGQLVILPWVLHSTLGQLKATRARIIPGTHLATAQGRDGPRTGTGWCHVARHHATQHRCSFTRLSIIAHMTRCPRGITSTAQTKLSGRSLQMFPRMLLLACKLLLWPWSFWGKWTVSRPP